MRWLSDIDAASSTSLSTARDLDPAQQQHREALLTVDSTCLIETIGELVRRGVFSYAKYLQRLTARGITAPATSPTLNGHGAADHQEKVKSNTSIHMKLVRSLPVYEQSSSLLHQRRVAIYGLRSKESWEEATERRALRELHALLPWLAGEPEENAPPPTSDDNVANCLPHLQAGSCYIKTRIMRLHLLPAVKQIGSGLTRTQFVVSARIMALANDFASLSEVSLRVSAILLQSIADLILAFVSS